MQPDQPSCNCAVQLPVEAHNHAFFDISVRLSWISPRWVE
jgi:hypothetical protein